MNNLLPERVMMYKQWSKEEEEEKEEEEAYKS